MHSRAKNYGAIQTNPEVGFMGHSSQDRNESIDWNRTCGDVETNIYTINSSIKTLQSALKTVGTAKDNEGLRKKIHVTQLSTNQIASETTKTLAILKSKAPRVEKQRQLQVEKLEEIFKEGLNKYNSVQKELVVKQKSNLLPLGIDQQGPNNTEDSENHQRQAQLAREIVFEQEMLIERESRVKQIEADVLDINEIMRELGSMVHEQGQDLDRIEQGIEHAAGNVQEGTEQLVKASRYQNKYRRKLIYLVILLLVVACILIAIIVPFVRGSRGGHSNSTNSGV